MKHLKDQAGFSAIEFVVAVGIIAVLAVAGNRVYNSQKDSSDQSITKVTTNGQSAKASDVTAAPEVESAGDLDKAAAALDETDPGGSNTTDASQLDAQLNNF